MRAVALAALAAAAFAQDDVAVDRRVMVPMRDGVRLATEIYRPAGPGRYPAILYRSPYDRQGLRGEATYLARHGYVVLAQDVRGRYDSEGRFRALAAEGEDGYDAIEWAAAQPWCDGRVATAGASYLAWVQYNAARLRPPHLAAMFALVGGSSYFDSSYPGGIPSLGRALWLLLSARTSPHAASRPALASRLAEVFRYPDPWLALPPARRGELLQSFPDEYALYREYEAHPTFDDYWKRPGLWVEGHYREWKDVPALFLSGWYDGFVEGVIRNFRSAPLQHRKLIVGPWPHDTGRSHTGDADFGPAAALDQRALAADWFGRWLKHAPFRIVDESPVRIFRMGGGDGGRTVEGRIRHGGEWRSLPAWPPPAHTTVLYLRGGALAPEPAAAGGAGSAFVHDPAAPVPTVGGRYGRDAVRNQAGLARRSDVLAFDTAPLPAALDVTGDLRVRLWVSSDVPESDFVVRLGDVYSDGYVFPIAEGQLRSTYRHGLERRVPMRPGEPAELTVPLGPASNLFAAGHRIRLEIAGSSFPRLEPHPAPARNTVYHDRTHSSRVELPVVRQ